MAAPAPTQAWLRGPNGEEATPVERFVPRLGAITEQIPEPWARVPSCLGKKTFPSPVKICSTASTAPSSFPFQGDASGLLSSRVISSSVTGADTAGQREGSSWRRPCKSLPRRKWLLQPERVHSAPASLVASPVPLDPLVSLIEQDSRWKPQPRNPLHATVPWEEDCPGDSLCATGPAAGKREAAPLRVVPGSALVCF